MTFHTMLFLIQNHGILELMRWIDLLEFMIGLDI